MTKKREWQKRGAGGVFEGSGAVDSQCTLCAITFDNTVESNFLFKNQNLSLKVKLLTY